MAVKIGFQGRLVTLLIISYALETSYLQTIGKKQECQPVEATNVW